MIHLLLLLMVVLKVENKKSLVHHTITATDYTMIEGSGS